MEPLSALSVACNIITLADAAVKTTETLYDLYESTSGFSSKSERLVLETDHLQDAVEQLRQANGHLSAYLSGDASIQSAAESAIMSLSGLRRFLESVVCRSQSRSNLQDLQADLKSATDQLKLSLAIATRHDIARTLALLDRADAKQLEVARKLDNLNTALQQADKKQDDLATQLTDQSAVLERIEQKSSLLEIIIDTITLSDDSRKVLNHDAILRAIGARTGRRFEDVSDPAANTFEWILSETNPNNDTTHDKEEDRLEKAKADASQAFLNWLRRGSGVFHILGKPGCGKSTLMKFIVKSEKTQELLQQWATDEKKKLIIPKFFFWKIGSGNQKTMRGLKRRLLYDIVKCDMEVAELLFQEYWFPERYGPRNTAPQSHDFSDGEISAAFDNMLKCDLLFVKYKICLIIDGLDEFDEPHESLWRLCSQLNSWTVDRTSTDAITNNRDLKLLISSREEPPILSAFPSAQRIIVHRLTESDVKALVQQRLDGNPHYQALIKRYPGKEATRFEDSIVGGAEGVFLWVVLLLKWIEEDLATGTSFSALENIVRTAPRELNDFFSRILETIPKHHYRGAWFIFAMLLRPLGFRPSGNAKRTSFATEDLVHPSTYGLFYVLDSFDRAERADPRMNPAFRIEPCHSIEDYRHREAVAGSRVQTWCRGLVEVRTDVDDGRTYTVFWHRTIPEFLSHQLQDTAAALKIDEDQITEASLTAILAEIMALSLNGHPQHPVCGLPYEEIVNSCLEDTLTHVSECSTALPRRTLELLDRIDEERQKFQDAESISENRDIIIDLGDSDNAFGRYHLGIPLVVTVAYLKTPMTDYVTWRFKNPKVQTNKAWHLLMLFAMVVGVWSDSYVHGYPSRASILQTLFENGLSPNTRYPGNLGHKFTLKAWLDNPQSESDQSTSGTSNAEIRSPWREVLWYYLCRIAFCEKETIPSSTWDDLEVWLRFGAEVPAEILLSLILWHPGSPWIPRRYTAIVGFRFPHEEGQMVMSGVGWERYATKDTYCYLQTFRSTTLSSLIRYHAPTNQYELLRFTDPLVEMAEGVQEWDPPSSWDPTSSWKPPSSTSRRPERDMWRSVRRWYRKQYTTTGELQMPWIHGLYWRHETEEWWGGDFEGLDEEYSDSEEEGLEKFAAMRFKR